MSKIFEALKRLESEQGAPLPSGLVEAADAPPEQTAAAPDEEAILAAATAGDPKAAFAYRRAQRDQTETAPALQPEVVRRGRLQVSQGSPVLPFDDMRWNASEQYRMIRTKIIQDPRKPGVIVVSSPGPGDGKSLTSINLAGALSLKSQERVLLVDGDLRRPTIHKHLGLADTPGLGDVLEGKCSLEEAIIQTEQFPSLYVLSAGERRANPAELFDSTQWRSVCERLRRSFQYVVIDSSPIAAVADYDLIQANCDGVLVVVRPDHTKRSECFQALQSIPKERLIGVVVNCIEDWFLGKKSYPSYYYQER